MSKYSEQEKLEAILRCVDEDMSYRHNAHILGCDPKLVEQWVKLYQIQGKKALESSHKHFSGKFKLYVVEYMYENQLSQMETSVLFDLPNRQNLLRRKGEINMYIYLDDRTPIGLEDLDIRQFIPLQEDEDGPLVKVRFSLDTPYLKRDFNLDLIIWNLNEDNLERTEQVVRYALKNFNKLFETGWTALYYQLCRSDDRVAEHTLQEFFVEQIDFESPYYEIQIEINCDHLKDGQARYCFVVSTTCDYRKWMIAEDNMRVYMIGNRACGFNDNNDDGQMRDSLEKCAMFYEMGRMAYEAMVRDRFQFAEPFKESR